MRILALSTWWPEPADNGSRIRIAQLLRALACEHEVHLVALAQESVQPEQRARLEQVCASAHAVPQRAWTLRRRDVLASLWRPEPASVRAKWNPAFADRVRERVAALHPELVIAFQIDVAPYARDIADAPRVLEELEAAYLLEQSIAERHPRRRLRAWFTWIKHRAYVSNLLRDFDACTVVSKREQAHIQNLAPRDTPVIVIPNGADVAGCAGTWGDPEPDTLLYAGALSFEANRDAVAYFLSASFPRIRSQRPNARLRVTGKVDAAQRAALPSLDGVEFTGYLPDVRPAIAQAWAEVVPLRKGGGTRLKVLEALALGTPVVSTSKGIEGLDLEHDRHVLVADGGDDFAAATIRLLAQPNLRARLSTAGQQRVRECYDWRVIGQHLNSLVRDLVKVL
ncbi:MAG TPA: glycosyltransferase family 4 protein [Anaerolineae bacterium]|nr:glycosyltransferase family 4 protein [Anaerolineae bacterium]